VSAGQNDENAHEPNQRARAVKVEKPRRHGCYNSHNRKCRALHASTAHVPLHCGANTCRCVVTVFTRCHNSPSWLAWLVPPSPLRERYHRPLARGFVAVCWVRSLWRSKDYRSRFCCSRHARSCARTLRSPRLFFLPDRVAWRTTPGPGETNVCTLAPCRLRILLAIVTPSAFAA
jgi:hypothetical protein